MTPIEWLLFALMLSAKALLVLAAALGLTRLMRDRSAAERHMVWVVASACVLALPVLSLAGPSWPIGVPSGWLSGVGERPAPRAVREVIVDVEPVTVEIVVPAAVRHEHVTRALGTPALAPVAPGGSGSRPAPVRVDGISAEADEANRVEVDPKSTAGAWSTIRSFVLALPFLALLVWLIGTAVVLTRIVFGFVHVRRVARESRPLLDPVLLVRAHGTASEMGVNRPLRLLEGDAEAMPITFGVLRPTLLLPATAREWSKARQNAVLRHELEHIRRRDSLSQLIAELGCALFWFNPLMWYAARRLRVEREHACDDAVLSAGSRPADYAAELVDIARALRSRRATEAAAIAMAGSSDLRSRVSSLLDTQRRRERPGARLLLPLWAGALLLVTPLSSLALELDTGFGANMDASLIPTGSRLESRLGPAARRTPPPAPSPADVSPDAPSALAPPFSAGALPPVTGAVQRDCMSRGRNTNVSSNTTGDGRTIRWSGSECSGEVVVQGDVQFDASFTTVTGVSRGGRLRITTEENGVERQVTITPAAGGVTHDYRVDGSRREMDATAHEWLSSTLLFTFRRFGFMAEERAAFLAGRGTNALLAEVDMLNSDFVRAKYLSVLIERGQLNEAALDRVLRIAGTKVGSDYYRAEILTSVAGHYELTDGVRDAYVRAVDGMESDHYRHAAYSTLLKQSRLSPAQVSAVLGETTHMESDYYRAALLDQAATSYRSSPDIRPAYLAAAAELGSDHHKSGVLMTLLSMADMSNADLAQVVDAAATLESDHYAANVLTRVVQNGLSDAALQRAFVRAASDIDSDHNLATVLTALAKQERLNDSALNVLLEAAEHIESDHYMSGLLLEVARHRSLDGESMARFEKLMDTIGSRTRRQSVAEALRRQSR